MLLENTMKINWNYIATIICCTKLTLINRYLLFDCEIDTYVRYNWWRNSYDDEYKGGWLIRKDVGIINIKYISTFWT